MTHLKPLILSGKIKTFQDLFNHATTKEIAQAMKCSIKHVETIRRDAGKVYLRDVFELSKAVGVHYGVISELWVE
jgi:hypothetical protein